MEWINSLKLNETRPQLEDLAVGQKVVETMVDLIAEGMIQDTDKEQEFKGPIALKLVLTMILAVDKEHAFQMSLSI